jgi:hypothetical protein
MKAEITPDGKLKLEFAYRKEMVEAIKELPERRYNPESKSWTIGFDESNLGSILAMLAGNRWPTELLDKIETEAKEYLKTHQPEGDADEFETKIKPPLMKMADLVLEAYMEGKISNIEQVEMLALINHLSLKDFITK